MSECVVACTCRARYNSFDNRVASYTGEWDSEICVLKLSEAGFFYNGFLDSVTCFYCSGAVRSWEPDDDPWREHAKHFPKCHFLYVNKGEQFIQQTQKDVKESIVNNWMNTEMIELLIDMDIFPIASIKQVLYNKYSSSQRPYYIFEHLYDAVESFCMENEEQNIVDQIGTLKIDCDDKFICKICLEKPIDTVFISCGHMVSCTICAVKLEACPICRKKIIKRLKTYYA